MNEIIAEIERKEQEMNCVGYSNINNSIKTFLDINRLRRSSNIRLLRIKYRGRNVIQIQIDNDKYNAHARLNKARIQSISNKLSSFLHDEGHHGMMSTSMQYSDLGYRSGYLSNFNQPVNLYEPSDSDKIFYKGIKNKRYLIRLTFIFLKRVGIAVDWIFSMTVFLIASHLLCWKKILGRRLKV